MADLTAAQRRVIPRDDFAIPSKAPGPGSYPIHDHAHAVAALRFSAGKPEEAQVRAAVKRKYPNLVIDGM